MPSVITSAYNSEYKKLNPAQKHAVDSIDGPVMVVAGPGTGKTQILALRIGNILLKTDTKADSILCLTFTNSAVEAMRERLRKYIGREASKVKVSTFHRFGLDMLEKYYPVLGLRGEPELMDEKDTIALCDEILNNNDWEYIRPRADITRYFQDLKSLISLLKRERITSEDFENEIKKEIKSKENNPENISTRGEAKGELKKDVQKQIEGLARSFEAVKFYNLYEREKSERNLFDYDDILEALVKIVEESDEARVYIKENFQYVLIDEHQDSSGVQNQFLEKVWGGEEKPDIFVVGDDRQLIYGFGGASLEYFENFKNTFGRAKLINLTENYRSTQKILDTAHEMLKSVMTKEKLKSNHGENHALSLVEADYPRDEIIFAGLEIKKKIEQGFDSNDMAILVPKNRQVRSTILILRDMGVPVSGGEHMDLFDAQEAVSLIRVLKILAFPGDGAALAESFFDKLSGISPLKAHRFIKGNKIRDFSLLNVVEEKNNLFGGINEINLWIHKLKSWLEFSTESLYSFLRKVGSEFLLDTAKNHEELSVRIEVLRTLLHLVLRQTEKNPKLNLQDFLSFINRIESYGENIPLAVFGKNEGVKVLTLHASKGLEYDFVWIAHMDEKSFASSKAGGFSLPENIKEKIETRDEKVLKRQLYVAITRAKRFCTISYALKSYSGGDLELAHIVADLSDNFEKQLADETEKIILKNNPKAYVAGSPKADKEITTNLSDLVKLVARDYSERRVSVSLLNNFFECPWKWYFRNLLKLPEAMTESLQLGNAVHLAIEKILKLKIIPTQKYLEKITNGDKEVLKIVSRWVKNRLGDIATKRENEQSVSVNDEHFPHLTIYGKIDLIEHLDSKGVRVTDFKTGSVKKKSEIEKRDSEGRMSSYLRQLAMYSYLIKKSPKWKVAVREGRLEFLEAKKEKEVFYDRTITAEEIDFLLKDINDYDNFIKEGVWVTRPCNYNSHGKKAVCEYCAMAEIYTGPLSNQPK
ncbi:MAG TPA: ATP-dependent DNA helicase [Candidatus Paceibacterota bacterium]|nr:ATP-dependent DNA helicase [Candidatus Paceibacterota bacterium]